MAQSPVFDGLEFLNGGWNQRVELGVVFPAGHKKHILPLLLFRLAFHELIKTKVSAFYQVTGNERPLGENDGSPIGAKQRERITAQNIALQNVPNSRKQLSTDGYGKSLVVFFIPKIQKPDTALFRIVIQYIYSIETGQCQNSVALILVPAFAVASFYDFQLASKHFSEEVTIAAGGLKKMTVYTGTFISNEIAHGFDFPFGGEDFAMRGHALF